MPEVDLKRKVADWLEGEGYPLEFRSAHAFHEAGFTVLQGEYVGGKKDDSPREIDVVAHKTRHAKDSLLRVYHVVECKWTKDKPWVVFTSQRSIASSACVTQTIGSLLGHAILWTVAGVEELHRTCLFGTPPRPGFNGRQALANRDNDVFYNMMRSVTSLSTLLMQKYNVRPRPERMPEFGAVAFPVVVIGGRLFEAWFDSSTGQMQLEERQQLRLHWRGSQSWSFHSTIDVIVADFLPMFARGRSGEVDVLLSVMAKTRDQIASCFEAKSLDALEVSKGPRGVGGLPPLLREIARMRKQLTAKEGEGS